MAAENKNVPNYVNKNTSRNYLAASFVLIVIGVFIVFFYFYKSYDYAQKCQTYVETEALVVDHKYDNNNRIVSTVIQYEIDGKTYTSTYNFKSLNIQPYGSTIKILYNPLHPDRITTIDSKISTLILYFGGFLVFIGFTSAIVVVNRKDHVRQEIINRKYVVPQTDIYLSNEYQVNTPVDSTYKQLANAINTATINNNANYNNINSAPVNEPKVEKEEIKEEVKPVVQETVEEHKEEVKEEIKPETKEKVNDDENMSFVSMFQEEFGNYDEQEEKTDNELPVTENVQKEQVQTNLEDPIELLLSEYSGTDDKVAKEDQFYKNKEKTKFEFASYANNTSINNANINEVGSFIPNIDDVEDLFIKKNNDEQ